MEHYSLLVIGGGAAGMAAALSAETAGCQVLLVEREAQLGGVLNQCVHNGFGLGYFGKDLTGLEYGERFRRRVKKTTITILTGVSVLSISKDRTALLSGRDGLRQVSFSKCILATGSRERSLYSLRICGTRPSGIFAAGTAQRLVNMGRYDIGNRIVILGSGDVGQIMARRFSLLGKQVVAMVEQKKALGGLVRNQQKCIDAYHIPVILCATIDEIHGVGRISGVTVRHLDSGEREFLPCDTLVTSLGLIPENSLTAPLMQHSVLPEWLTCCGNCDYIHEIVDSVTFQAERLGTSWGKRSFV